MLEGEFWGAGITDSIGRGVDREFWGAESIVPGGRFVPEAERLGKITGTITFNPQLKVIFDGLILVTRGVGAPVAPLEITTGILPKSWHKIFDQGDIWRFSIPVDFTR